MIAVLHWSHRNTPTGVAKMDTEIINELIALQRKARETGGAVTAIAGRQVRCFIVHQRRNGLRVTSERFDLDGKATPYTKVCLTLGAV